MRSVGAGVVLTLLSGTTAALAEPTPADRALATDLFVQARALVAEGRYAEACPKFAESQRLDPGAGTVLNLAYCHELEGKTATAWAEFNEALAVAEREGQADRVAFAEEHIASLTPRLPRLRIVVPADLEGTELDVSRDGSSVSAVALGTAMPVDPGAHRIEVKARGFEPWRATVAVSSGEHREITIGPLAPVPPRASPRAPDADHARPVASAPVEPPPGHARTVGWILGGVGGLGLAVGAASGVVAISADAKSDSRCTPRCDEEGFLLNQDAKTAADVATVSLAVGAVAMGAAVYLLLTNRPSKPLAAGALRF